MHEKNITHRSTEYDHSHNAHRQGIKIAYRFFVYPMVIIILFTCNFAYYDTLQAMDPEEYSTYTDQISTRMQLFSDLSFSANSYINGECVYYDDVTSPQEKEDIYVMYNRLDDADKNVYNMFLDLVEHRDGGNYTNGIIITKQQLAQIGADHFWNIYEAMVYDHPEYFFLTSNPDIIQCHSIATANYKAYIYTMDAETELDRAQQLTFDLAVDDFMYDIDLSLSPEEIELAIHDKLISLVSYDYDLLDEMNLESSIYDLSHTAYGALVSNSSGSQNTAVCDGYSLAFEYLCQLAGIPCCIVTGSAESISDESSSESGNGHTWNAVSIYGDWYEVDATWNDYECTNCEDIEFYEAIQEDTDKFDNLIHHFYNRTTDEMEYLCATDDTLFDVDGYFPVNIRKDTSHVRYTTLRGDVNDQDAFRNRLVPIAW